ncbi:ribonuclease E inhibitor RraA/Dimethylmenaquinone methyltransferase [Ilyonectria robusta]|uniref:ribonuclease E inhibitor RraA/Dimethylmenaquinone methyltransferase n=1 Tax=Ilyonectria robusta TaxID=1079257 RepID=UPI001E8CF999|nr:ribonuclease E inhibitor RraA/Dimethylmenaquinone methyltransferase [Ilyonectria robusta]KAH8683826.1 ribonuclease E inhibitor RraA/Dimethylmenaquinone methyltransferase [Ilyonectria robusta]
MSDQSLVEALRPYSACDIADALVKLNVPDGGFLSGLAMWSPEFKAGATKIIGPAYTVQYVRHTSVSAEKQEEHYIDNVPAGAVIFISSPPHVVNSVYGGLMTARAKSCGAAGTVVDGRIRDLQEHRDQTYPVFARDTGTTAYYQALRLGTVGAPVRLQGLDQNIVVNPGDMIFGDLDGVICIPRDLVQAALQILPAQRAADEKIRRDIDEGAKFCDSSARHRG